MKDRIGRVSQIDAADRFAVFWPGSIKLSPIRESAVCIEKEKIGLGEDAKQMMLDVFRIWDDESQVRDFRKKLSMLLY